MKISTTGHEVSDDVKMHRTMVRFVSQSDDLWYVVLPGWSIYVAIAVRGSNLPDFIQEKAARHYRCFAKVNIGENDPFHLIFEDWELGLPDQKLIG